MDNIVYYPLRKVEDGEIAPFMDYGEILEVRDFLARWMPDILVRIVPQDPWETSFKFLGGPLSRAAHSTINTLLYIHLDALLLIPGTGDKNPDLWDTYINLLERGLGTLRNHHHALCGKPSAHRLPRLWHAILDQQIQDHKMINSRIKAARLVNQIMEGISVDLKKAGLYNMTPQYKGDLDELGNLLNQKEAT